MGRVLSIFGIVLSAAILCSSAVVSAETISRSNQITVNAVVLPAHSVIVDEYGQVIKIYSNTTQSAVPTFYRDTIDDSTKLAGNNELLAQYQRVVTGVPGKIGVIYERSVAFKLLPPVGSKTTLPPIITSLTLPLVATR